MATIVYILCAATSLVCSVLLLRAYTEGKVRLLLWSGICFLGFALNNVLLIVDTQVVPGTDLSIIRSMPALIGVAVLVYGMIWDTGT